MSFSSLAVASPHQATGRLQQLIVYLLACRLFRPAERFFAYYKPWFCLLFVQLFCHVWWRTVSGCTVHLMTSSSWHSQTLTHEYCRVISCGWSNSTLRG